MAHLGSRLFTNIFLTLSDSTPEFSALSDLASLKQAFKGDIITPEDPDYAKAISRWAINAERRAKIVAFVRDTSDASLAIKYASAKKLPIAIRGGGHSAAGNSSSEGGLVIDLSRYMNTVTVDPAKKLASVGGGAVWETVDETAIKYGLATVGVTVNHVRSIVCLCHFLSDVTKRTCRPESEGPSFPSAIRQDKP